MLLVSDEHEKWEMLDKLVERVKGNKYDVVLMSGDQGNAKNVIVGTNCAEMNKVSEESNKRYVSTLEKLAPLMFYIPGNHDAEELFTSKPKKVGEHATNLHLKFKKILPDLIIAGMGGSMPTLL
jgi:Icc-related predicted phosphoesterase